MKNSSLLEGDSFDFSHMSLFNISMLKKRGDSNSRTPSSFWIAHKKEFLNIHSVFLYIESVQSSGF